MQTTIVEKRFFFILLLINFILAFFVFRPFLIVLILAISFAMILYPLFKWFKRRKLASWLSALMCVLIFLIVICGPIYAIGNIVLEQSVDAYNSLAHYGSMTPFTESINASINKILPDNLFFDINEKIADLAALITKNLLGIFSTTLTTIFSFFLMLLAIFYFLKDGQKWKEALVQLSPLKDSDDLKIINSFYRTVNGVIKGYLLIALIQGTLMAIGLKIFGVPNPALWGVITALASMIPTIGTGFVSVPAIIYLYFTGSIGSVIGMIIWAVLIVGLVDNLLNPIIVSRNIKIPMLLILFSVLGGIALLGPVGILIGPLIISLLHTLLSIYRKEFENN